MKPCTFLAALLLALLLSPGLPPIAAQDEGEWVRPYPAYLPGLEPNNGKGEKTVVSVRLLRREASGLHVFVPHGRVGHYTEESHPQALGARLLARGEGDEFGFVNVLPLEAPEGDWESSAHWHIEGPGQGVEHEYCPFGHFDEEEIILPGGVDREIHVIDPFGRPLKGARVSMYLGCPHSPALRSGKTGRRGAVSLPNLPADRDEDFWVEAPGVRCGPYSLTPPWVGNPATTLLTEPARNARGVVVDESGEPIAGVVVRATGGYPRGPVTVTDAEGEFVLNGVEEHHRLSFYLPESPHVPRPDCVVRDFEEEVPLRVTLQKDRPTSLTDGEVRHAVDIVALHRQNWLLPDGTEKERWVETDRAPVVLSRRSDGFTVRGKTGDGGFRVVVPAGKYLIKAGGGFSYFRVGVKEEDLPRPAGETVRVEMPGDQPGVSIDKGAYKPRKYVLPDTVEVRIPGMVKDLSDWHQYYGLKAPPGRLGFFLSPPARIVPASDRKVCLDAPRRNRIRFKCVEANGRPVVPGSVRIDWDELEPEKMPDGRLQVRTWACGRVAMGFGDLFYEGTVVSVELPVEEAGIVDIGTVVLAAEEEDADETESRTIRLLFGNGNPITGEDQHWCGIRVMDGWEGTEWEAAEADENGEFHVSASRGPFRLQLAGPGFLPHVAEIRPDGPSEIRLPPGKITGLLRGVDRKALPGIVYVDSTRFECPEGKFEIRGVASGQHIVIIGAKGHVGEVRQIVLKEGEARDLQMSLTPR